VAAYATLATRMMCRLLGVPDADVPVFAAWLNALSPVFLTMTPEQIAAATTAIKELQSYVDELTSRRSKDPGAISLPPCWHPRPTASASPTVKQSR
jgi:cytochrome P450